MKTGKAGRSILGTVLMVLGALMVFGAAGLLAYNCWDDQRAGAASEEAAQALVTVITDSDESAEAWAETAAVADEEGMEIEAPVVEIEGSYYIGVLSIPALDLTLPVQSGWSLDKLKTSPCCYYGSAAQENMVIAAHNYRQHFGYLGNLGIGEQVIFTDTLGRQYLYQVAEILTSEATDIEGMTGSDYELTLFTCTRGGQARLTVRCRLQ